MAVLTGADGQLKYRGQAVAKAREWSISVSKDALETTCLASYDRSYVAGLRGATGSATVLYDPNETRDKQFLNSIWKDGVSNESVAFCLNRADGTQFSCEGFLTSVSPSVSVGAVQAVSISFQISGPIDGRF